MTRTDVHLGRKDVDTLVGWFVRSFVIPVLDGCPSNAAWRLLKVHDYT